MARTRTISDGIITISLLNFTGYHARRGGLGKTRIRPNLYFGSSALFDGAALKHVKYPPITEKYTLDLLASSHDNAAAQTQQLMELLEKAQRYFTEPSWQRTPVYITEQTTNETNARYALVYGTPDRLFPDLFTHPFEADNWIEEFGVSIIRAPFWGSHIPGTMSSALTLTHPDHPDGTASEIVVPNYRDEHDLTHIYNYDANLAAWSGNLIGTSVFDYFVVAGSTPAVGDMVYFGSTEGPFHNFVMNLGTLLSATGYTFAWGYSIAGPGFDFTPGVFDDFSYGLQGSDAKGSAWEVYPVLFPGWSDWTQETFHGVDAWWIALNITGLTVWTTSPAQSDHPVYTTNNPYLEIGATILDGDYDAIMAYIFDAVTGVMTANPAKTDLSRIIIGARSRGLTNFISRLNCNNQAGANPTEWVLAVGSDSNFTTDTRAPSGRRITCTFAGTITPTYRVRFTMPGNTNADDFRGIFRVFVRCQQIGGSDGDVEISVGMSTSSFALTAYEWQSETIALQDADNGKEIVDCGVVHIPAGDYDAGDTMHNLRFEIIAEAANSTPDLYLYDLILIPIDEWAAVINDPLLSTDVTSPNSALLNRLEEVFGDAYASSVFVDGGLRRPFPRAVLNVTEWDESQGEPSPIVESARISWELRGGEVKLPPDKQIRLYFLLERWKNDYGTPPLFGSIQSAVCSRAYAHERWFRLRGSD